MFWISIELKFSYGEQFVPCQAIADTLVLSWSSLIYGYWICNLVNFIASSCYGVVINSNSFKKFNSTKISIIYMHYTKSSLSFDNLIYNSTFPRFIILSRGAVRASGQVTPKMKGDRAESCPYWMSGKIILYMYLHSLSLPAVVRETNLMWGFLLRQSSQQSCPLISPPLLLYSSPRIWSELHEVEYFYLQLLF